MDTDNRKLGRRSRVSIMEYRGISPKIDNTVYLADGVRLSGKIEIGRLSSLWFNVAARGDVGRITIGQRTNIQDNSVIHVTRGQRGVEIGDAVTVGHGAIIHECRIANQTLIGMGAILLDECSIGKYTMVAAGSLCPPRSTYPEGSLVMGSPAKVVRKLSKDEIEAIDFSAEHYVDLASSYQEIEC